LTQGRAGGITSNKFECQKADIEAEFTKMIVAQRPRYGQIGKRINPTPPNPSQYHQSGSCSIKYWPTVVYLGRNKAAIADILQAFWLQAGHTNYRSTVASLSRAMVTTALVGTPSSIRSIKFF